MSQSRVGVRGKEALLDDWSGVFQVETYFNPQSGNLADGPKSLVLNNGKALTAQSTGVDSSVAGQPFEIAYAGVSSVRYGTLTFGRQTGLMADGIAKYDPLATSQAFSVIGYSGVAAGGGVTQDRRLDQSLKYAYADGGYHLGAQYRFNGSNGASRTAVQLQLGADFAGASVDGSSSMRPTTDIIRATSQPGLSRAAPAPRARRAAENSRRSRSRPTIASPSGSTDTSGPCGAAFRLGSPMAIRPRTPSIQHSACASGSDSAHTRY